MKKRGDEEICFDTFSYLLSEGTHSIGKMCGRMNSFGCIEY